jgi:hypothetical protein
MVVVPADRWRGDDGSAVVELIPLSVMMFAFVALIIFVGRVNVAYAQVEGAARSAARAISIARDPGAAVAEAKAAATEAVGEGTSICEQMTFRHSPAELTDASEVTVEISCVVDVSGAVLVEVPGSLSVDAAATEAIDRHREVTR